MLLSRKRSDYSGLVLCGALSLASVAQAAEKISYNESIRPIFNTSCVGCHGGVKKSAGVSFIYREEALGVSDNGNRVIIPGDPENSEIVKRISSDDDRYVMPPAQGDNHHDPLSSEKIELIKEWIRQGAEWEEHWAYIKPVRRQVTPVKNDWVRTPMDAYVLDRLERNGLSPGGEAPRSQWLRRVSLDLTGLPPTLDELQSFTADTSADAYEKVVDRLLASLRYGERWAAMWMDLARYADSQGYEKDRSRVIWPYRDWLIDAFNKDVPYTEFIRDQLAGDLLDEPTTAQLIATGFIRLTQTNDEGGTDDEQFRVAAVQDRMNVSWVSFQGITFACIQCHSHPYEPIPHEDYYRYMSYFNNTEDCDMSDDFPLHIIANDASKRNESTAAQLDVIELKRQRNELGSIEMRHADQWHLPSYGQLTISAGSIDQQEGVLFAEGGQPPGTHYVIKMENPQPAKPLTAVKVSILPDSDKPEDAPFRGSVLSHIVLKKTDQKGGVTTLAIERVYADSLSGPHDPLESLKGSPRGFGGYPKLFQKREAVFVLKEPVVLLAGEKLTAELKCSSSTSGGHGVMLRKFQLHLTYSDRWQPLLSSDADKQLAMEIAERQKVVHSIKGIRMPVARDRSPWSRRETRLFIGGNRLNKGEAQEPGVPEVLNPYGAPAGNRLEMAQWLTHPDNSLTARVFVNRLFSELFGYGIVRTLGDFGSSGLAPSNLPLLDYLAVAFREDHQWKIKPLLKEVVLSASYRQDHKSTPELTAMDPQNLLLARGPRTRLSAEMIRDNALAASGLIAHRRGGSSVMPPQPEGVWRAAYSGEKWTDATGPDRYRRALYTFWKRTSPYPSMMTFDAPARDACGIQRIVSNTPLQPLITLNDPVYLECAQSLAKAMADYEEGDVRAKIAYAHLLTTQQEATEFSLTTLEDLYHELVEDYKQTPFDGLAMSQEEASLVNIAGILLNIDSALTK